MMISVILPVLNSSAHLPRVLGSLERYRATTEVIAVDGGSIDESVAMLNAAGGITIRHSKPGRARQMNAGAEQAAGSILLFLHSDCVLEKGWPDAVQAAAAQPDFALGAFTLKLDHLSWQARLIEWGVRQRNRWCHLPYGDQAQFIKTDDFKRLGGFPDQPLMEDVELAWKARRSGRVVILPESVTTSARKWMRDGWGRRTLNNWRTYRSYKAGRNTAEELSRDYYGDRCAVAVFAKAPTAGRVKTRLAAGVGDEAATHIYRYLCRHTLAQISAAEEHSDINVLYDPPGAEIAMREWLGSDFHYHAQIDGDLGARMLAAFTHLGKMKYKKIVIIGTDCPGVQASHINQALIALNEKDLVLGPTADGGYYLIAARDPHPELFHDMPWSTDQVLPETLRRAKKRRLEYALLEPQHDLDTRADLDYHVQQHSLPASLCLTKEDNILMTALPGIGIVNKAPFEPDHDNHRTLQ